MFPFLDTGGGAFSGSSSATSGPVTLTSGGNRFSLKGGGGMPWWFAYAITGLVGLGALALIVKR